jgi:hypothetical protein
MRKVWQVVLAMFYLVLRMLAYLGLTILSLFGNTPPRRKLELWVVSIQDPRTAFYEPIIWLFVSITMAYATVTITDTIPKLICGILAFLFVLSFQRQFLTIEPLNSFQRFLSGFFLPILKKLENIFVLIFILLVFFGIVSWLNKDIQVLHLLPFSAILIYFIYVRTKFLPQQTE